MRIQLEKTKVIPTWIKLNEALYIQICLAFSEGLKGLQDFPPLQLTIVILFCDCHCFEMMTLQFKNCWQCVIHMWPTEHVTCHMFSFALQYVNMTHFHVFACVIDTFLSVSIYIHLRLVLCITLCKLCRACQRGSWDYGGFSIKSDKGN